MHASPTRERCDVVIVTAETACADFQYDESLYDGSRFTLLLRLTRWHMWASHTAFIIVHAFALMMHQETRASQLPVVSELVAAGGRCRRLTDKAKTEDVSKQSRRDGWIHAHSTCANGEMTMIEQACAGPCVRQVAALRCPVQLPQEATTLGGDNNTAPPHQLNA